MIVSRLKVLFTLILSVIISLSFTIGSYAEGYSSDYDSTNTSQINNSQEEEEYPLPEFMDMYPSNINETNITTQPTELVQIEQELQPQSQKLKKYVDGYSVNGRLMVPIRKIADTLGLRVKFEGGKLVVEDAATTIEFILNSKKYIVNGTEFTSENETIMLSGQNYVPFSVLAKEMNITYFNNPLYKWIEIVGEKEDVYIYIKPETSMYAYKPKEIAALMYHHFQQESIGDGGTISTTRFKEHLQALKAAGYETITELDFLHYQQGKINLPQKPLMITIDDGYISNYLEAFPILAQEGYKATIYVITNNVGKKPGFSEYMNWEHMKEMVASGVINIQSHTHDLHFQLPKTGTNRGYALVDLLPRVKEDIRLSKKLIEENVGNKVFALAYPYGVYNKDVIKMLEEEGYQLAFSVVQGKNDPKNSTMELKRFIANGKYTGEDLISKIK
ncbi:MAG TPA: polysaccharide deacetylase family protein [Bacillus bacterium]|nr:polysaccharide deacetylase family protein [Bacillus sp. (in: firmicutes)]